LVQFNEFGPKATFILKSDLVLEGILCFGPVHSIPPVSPVATNIFSSNKRMNKLKPFAVVSFPAEKTVSIVSSSWLNQATKLCRWPPVTDVETALKKHRSPANSWAKYKYHFILDFGKFNKLNSHYNQVQIIV
jgi:hypothetical protein